MNYQPNRGPRRCRVRIHRRLAGRDARPQAPGLFAVDEVTAEAIRAIFAQEGEWSAAVELRRRLPLITDIAEARTCARTNAGWTPLPATPRPVTRLHPGRSR